MIDMTLISQPRKLSVFPINQMFCSLTRLLIHNQQIQFSTYTLSYKTKEPLQQHALFQK